LSKLSGLMSTHLRLIRDRCEAGQAEVDVNTRFIDRIDFPSPNEVTIDPIRTMII
jgi:hypothetical protein